MTLTTRYAPGDRVYYLWWSDDESDSAREVRGPAIVSFAIVTAGTDEPPHVEYRLDGGYRDVGEDSCYDSRETAEAAIAAETARLARAG
jgi:hypothetical protein